MTKTLSSWTKQTQECNNNEHQVTAQDWPLHFIVYELRERVGVIIHQDCDSCSIIPFLDFDTARSECINRRMKTGGGAFA